MTEKMFEEEDLTREMGEIPASIYDNGEPIITRSFTPKQTASEVSEKRLSRRVLWTVVTLVGVGLAGAGLFLALNVSR